MPWYGAALPTLNPGAGVTLADTNALPSFGQTQTSLLNVQVYVWTNCADPIDVVLQQVAPDGTTVLVAQTIPVAYWAYFTFQNLQALINQRVRVRTVDAVSGKVHASIAVALATPA
jgi:hypothetical protein